MSNVQSVKIVQSPFDEPIGVAGNLVIMPLVISEKAVKAQISPNITEYKQNADVPGAQVRGLTVTQDTQHTRMLDFDFAKNQHQTFQVENRHYGVSLMQIGTEEREGQKFRFCEFQVTELAPQKDGKPLELDKEGTFTVRFKSPAPNWWADGKEYRIGTVNGPQMSVTVVKHADNTVEVEAVGPFKQAFVFRHPAPPAEKSEKGLFVALRWKSGEVDLFLNDQRVETKKAVGV